MADDGVKWDALTAGDQAVPPPWENPWEHEEWDAELMLAHKPRAFWCKLPDNNRAMLEVKGIIPFEDILAIDENGDEMAQVPQVFVKFGPDNHPFKYGAGEIIAGDRRALNDPKNKVKFFPDELPEVDQQSIPADGE